MGSLDGKVMHCLAEFNCTNASVVVVLAVVKLPHEVGKVPVMSLPLTSKWPSCDTINQLSV